MSKVAKSDSKTPASAAPETQPADPSFRASRSGAERKHDSIARYGRVKRLPCANRRRRWRLERNTAAWLRHYFPEAFPLPFGPPHLEIIGKAEYAIENGTNTAVAAPRATGKTTTLWGVELKAVLTGKANFPVQAPWEAKGVKQALRFWKNALCFNERLAADYPEFCAPFQRAKGNAQQLMSLCWDDKRAANTGARLQLSDGKILLPDSRGILGSTTINGNPRGMNHSTEDGRVIRPDIVMLDDPQSHEVAKSPGQVSDVIESINSDVLAMGGPGKKMAAFMACTVIKRNDVAEYYLNNPEWDAIRIRRIVEWPKGFNDPKSKAAALWKEFAEIREEGLQAHDKGRAALRFYRKHKAEMIEGMKVSWLHRFDRGQPDAYFGAMWDYYRLGSAAFHSEHQNEPMEEGSGTKPYSLTVDIICKREDPTREAFVVPEWVIGRIASTDLNPSYAFSSAVVGFGRDQTSAVLWYGKYTGTPLPIDGNLPAPERKRRMFETLVTVGRQIAALPCKPDAWNIDASGEYFETILRFCEESVKLCGIQAIGCTGVSGKNYRPFGKTLLGKVGEYCYMKADVKDGRRIRWFNWHTHYWGEVAQRAWLGTAGAPGTCTLFRGNHREFADQIVREQNLGKADIGGQTFWNFRTAPGPHDFHDVLAQAFAAAAWGGVGTQTAQNPPPPETKRRKPSGITVIPM